MVKANIRRFLVPALLGLVIVILLWLLPIGGEVKVFLWDIAVSGIFVATLILGPLVGGVISCLVCAMLGSNDFADEPNGWWLFGCGLLSIVLSAILNVTIAYYVPLLPGFLISRERPWETIPYVWAVWGAVGHALAYGVVFLTIKGS